MNRERMRRDVIRIGWSAALVFAQLATGGCRRSAPREESLRVLCGSSMAGPVQDLARSFTRAHGLAVEMDLGGSETLLPKMLAGAPADIFVCHDPFEAKVRAAGRWAGAAVVGYLRPVLVVKQDNPLGIRTVEDLARPGVKIGLGDPRYSTCGELFLAALDHRGLRERVMPQVVLQARSPSDAATGLMVGSLDVAVVWNFSAVLYAGKVATVETGMRYPEVRVTVIGLSDSAHAVGRDAFLHWCARPEALQLFRERGYTAAPADRPASP